MRAAHAGGAVEIGDRAREFQHPVVSARREGEPLGGLAHQRLRAGVGRGEVLDRARWRSGVGRDAGQADRRVPLGLNGARRRDAAGDLGRTFGGGGQDQIGCNSIKLAGPCRL